MNMTEWVQTIVWIALVLVLGVVEIFTLDFIFIMLAAGAAGGLIAALLGAPWWLSSDHRRRPRARAALARPPAPARRARPRRRPAPHATRGAHRHAPARSPSRSPPPHPARSAWPTARPGARASPPTPPTAHRRSAPRVVVESIEGSTAVVRLQKGASLVTTRTRDDRAARPDPRHRHLRDRRPAKRDPHRPAGDRGHRGTTRQVPQDPHPGLNLLVPFIDRLRPLARHA